MCGIFACVQFGTKLQVGDVATATTAIRHRGPDDEGFALIGTEGRARLLGGEDTPVETYSAGGRYAPQKHWSSDSGPFRVGLGHRRLAILDLSAAGHQPMCDPQRKLWLSYNGEIYNYRELRAELEADGFRFRTGTDTEVVLAAYQKWGEGCLDHFNGMWAFVLIDLDRQKLFAAGDRFAIKPLYIWTSPSGNQFFASELKQFAQLPEWNPQLHEHACHEFLSKGNFNHVNQTLLRSVLRLRGGEKCSMSIADSLQRQPRIEAWYELPAESDVEELDDAAATQRFYDLFSDSIRLRLRADVKVGSCLSGGLDSSSIVSIANAQLRDSNAAEKQETISSCYEDPRFDERQYIQRVVESLGVTAHYVFPTVESMLERASAMAWQLDGPFFSGSTFSQWNVFAAAKQHGLIVMLDGQGADEQLGGYHKYFPPLFAELLRTRQLVQYWQQLWGWSWRHASLPEGVAMTTQLLLRHRLFAKAKASLVTAPVSATSLYRRPKGEAGGELTLPSKSRNFNELLRAQIQRTSLPRLLHYEDRNSMAHSVEARVPFLDYRLVEFLVNQPISRKIRRGETKVLLRDAMRKRLPEEVRSRQDKMGFVSPEQIWMRGPHAPAFRDSLSNACNMAEAFVDGPELLTHFDRYCQGQNKFSSAYWRVMSFGHWLQEFKIST